MLFSTPIKSAQHNQGQSPLQFLPLALPAWPAQGRWAMQKADSSAPHSQPLALPWGWERAWKSEFLSLGPDTCKQRTSSHPVKGRCEKKDTQTRGQRVNPRLPKENMGGYSHQNSTDGDKHFTRRDRPPAWATARSRQSEVRSWHFNAFQLCDCQKKPD